MIGTRKKPVEQVLVMLHGVRRVALVGCGNCATACQTGGEKELEQMRQLLQEQGIETVGSVLPDECCHMLLVKRGGHRLSGLRRRRADRRGPYCGSGFPRERHAVSRAD